ncbi:MAG: ferrochelatase [Candidatus Omnitrophota bacterium]|nr:ferrochelatase [Candidatus Omnitrophota bacterium]
MSYDHILLIGFGGPTSPEEVRPFLENVARGRRIPEARLHEVAHHYEAIGGSSPYNEYTFRFAGALRRELIAAEEPLPIYVGMRNWNPFLRDTLREIKRNGATKGIAIILATHRSEASCRRYKQNLRDAQAAAAAQDIAYDYVGPWFDHPLFIEAQAEGIRAALNAVAATDRADVHVIFSAHSIPVEMNDGCNHCQYADEFKKSCDLTAEALLLTRYTCAYQSRSGNPRQPWLEPDINDEIRRLAAAGCKRVIVAPIGFLCNNAEVLYDLDLEAHQTARECGMHFHRVRTAMDQPQFAQMMSLIVQQQLEITLHNR